MIINLGFYTTSHVKFHDRKCSDILYRINSISNILTDQYNYQFSQVKISSHLWYRNQFSIHADQSQLIVVEVSHFNSQYRFQNAHPGVSQIQQEFNKVNSPLVVSMLIRDILVDLGLSLGASILDDLFCWPLTCSSANLTFFESGDFPRLFWGQYALKGSYHRNDLESKLMKLKFKIALPTLESKLWFITAKIPWPSLI